MDFARRLQGLLRKEDGTLAATGDEISSWNKAVEALLYASPEEQKRMLEPSASEEAINKQELDDIARNLKEGVVVALSDAIGMALDENDAVGETEVATQQRMKFIMDKLKGHNGDDAAAITIHSTSKDWVNLENLCRTTSNFFRWYLQVYLQQYPLVMPMCSSPFQASTMLTIILFLIEFNAKISVDASELSPETPELPPSQRFARYAALLLFYATFSPRSPNDQDMQRTHERLVSDLHIIPRVLKILTYQPHTSPALALSLIRNVHNLLASYQGAIQAVQQTGFPFDPTTAKAPWSPKKDDNTNGLITYPSIFRDILIWSLNAPGLPPFPGPEDDRRCDLVVEILGIIFAMGGTEITRALRYPCPNSALSQLVITVLQDLDSTQDSRIAQVQLSTITILTDASPSFGTFLVEKEAFKSLLEITEGQINTVLEQTQVDATAVSALVPSLAVLYKLSAGNPDFRTATKNHIFPPDQEDQFWTLAQEQLAKTATATAASTNHNYRVPPAKNMHPLDAPQGTLRYKLIRLMTWTESHVKRYASELLWALCDEDSKEFVLRTGLGNAMAFLGAKGLVSLPAHALE